MPLLIRLKHFQSFGLQWLFKKPAIGVRKTVGFSSDENNDVCAFNGAVRRISVWGESVWNIWTQLYQWRSEWNQLKIAAYVIFINKTLQTVDVHHCLIRYSTSNIYSALCYVVLKYTQNHINIVFCCQPKLHKGIC